MEITLPKAVMDELPAPDKNGIVRVTVGLRITGDEADIVEINDTPVPDDEGSENEPDADDSMPSPSDVAGQTQY